MISISLIDCLTPLSKKAGFIQKIKSNNK